MKIKRSLYSGLLLCSSVVHLYGQQKPSVTTSMLNEIQILGPKVKTSEVLKDRNVVVLDQQFIASAPVSSIEELLSFAIGVDVRQRGPFGTQADISIDGGSYEQTLLLLNGQKIIDGQTSHNAFNLPIALDLVQSIEIIKGPSAVIYGVNSLAGVVNIITKKPVKSGFFAHAFGGTNFERASEQRNSQGLYFNQGYEIGASFHKDNHNHLLSGSWLSSNGQRYNSGFDNRKIFYQGHIDLDPKNALNIMAGHVRSDFGANGFYAAPGDRESKEVVSTTLVHVGSDHYLSQKFNLHSAIGYRYNEDDYWYYKDKPDVARSQHFTHSINAELKGDYIDDFATYYIGLQGSYQQIASSNIGAHSFSNYGVFAGILKQFNVGVDVNTGVYINQNSQYGAEVFPGIEISYQYNSTWKVMLSANSASRLPSFTDLYLDQRPGNMGNPDLMPERAYQYQIGTSYTKTNFTAQMYFFHRRINDFIDWVRPDNTTPFMTVNQGTNKTNGFNASLKYVWGDSSFRWSSSLAYAYLDPKISGQEQLISKYALEQFKHQTIFSLSAITGAWSFGVFERFNQRLSQKSYWLTDAKVSYTKDKYRFYIDAQNIFNQKYTEVGAVPATGRWMMLGVVFNGI